MPILLTYSCEQFRDRLAAVDDLDRAAERADVFVGRIDVESLADRREQVVDGDRVVIDRAAVFRGGSDDLASLDAAASHRGVEDARVVVPTAARIDFGSATELAHPDDERLVEQTAFFQIADERGHAGIGGLNQRGGAAEDVLVCVPVAAGSWRAARRDFDERHARFDHAAREQAAFAKFGIAVAGASRWRLVIELEAFDFRAEDQL
ncbi:MAG: hypothetical protein FD138_2314 [Planctomycetota bacterium]|nr:MAG: hypothetical protein FD138_2314 [Planctomycetota bacterium]